MASLIINLTLVLLMTLLIGTNAEPPEDPPPKQFSWDQNGYVFFCLCMGRFGNQMDHFLGALAFAKALNRTIVLPPFRTYRNVRFDEHFQTEPLSEYHRHILAEDFMEHLAPTHWPPGNRSGWCWQPPNSAETKCEMKNGNPFTPFWDGLGVDFDSSVIFNIGFSDSEYTQWKEKYPPSIYPVMALRGAPASFPVKPHHRELQKYLKFSQRIDSEADKYIDANFYQQKFVGIHLRNGDDWANACKHADNTPSYMSSPQCLEGTGRPVTSELCFPSKTVILSLLRRIVVYTKVKVVFVATDKNPLLPEIRKHLSDLDVQVFHADPWSPLIDVNILIRSEYFIGNCVSSFTSFVKRARDVEGKPSAFWSFDN